MAIANLPLFAGIYHYGFVIDLDRDGITRRLELRFNPRDVTGTDDGAWWLNMFRADGTVLLAGLKLSLGRNKFARFHYRAGMPKGELHVVDSSGFGVEPGRDELGARVVVQYEGVT